MTESKFSAWIKERVPINEVATFFKKKTVPVHKHSIWYYFGGITLILFVSQIISGVLLLFYYKPGAESAFESVQFIMTKVRFGWLIRSLHSWGANVMIFFLFIHMFSAFFMKAYRRPREITWLTGVGLLFCALGFGFYGYLLPWNELAFFATQVGTEIAHVIPVVGKPMLTFLRGGEHVTGATLSRFFAIHVAILPAITFLLLAVHLFLIQMQGNAVPLSLETLPEEKKRVMPFFPDFAIRDLLAWMIVLGVMTALAAIYPWELGDKVDPFAAAPEGIMPEWYFIFMFQALKMMPAKFLFLDGELVAVGVFALGAVFWIFVPFLDKWSQKGQRSSVFTIIGWWIIAFMTIMTIIAFQ